MNQATWIGVALLIGFVVFITLRGELPDYRKVVGL